MAASRNERSSIGRRDRLKSSKRKVVSEAVSSRLRKDRAGTGGPRSWTPCIYQLRLGKTPSSAMQKLMAR